MKWFLIVAVCLLPSIAHGAAADSTAAPLHPNSLRAGAWAVQFDVNGQIMNFESFSGGVSLKRQFSPKWALRFGVGFNAQGRTANPDLVDNPDYESSLDSYGVSIETVYQRYLNPDGVVNAYWGLGPLVHFSRRTAETSSDSTHAESTHTGWSVGAIASFGVEWFFTRQFSLHGEYTGSGGYSSSEREDIGTSNGQSDTFRRSEESGWSLGTTDQVRLGLSVYF